MHIFWYGRGNVVKSCYVIQMIYITLWHRMGVLEHIDVLPHIELCYIGFCILWVLSHIIIYYTFSVIIIINFYIPIEFIYMIDKFCAYLFIFQIKARGLVRLYYNLNKTKNKKQK